MSAERASTQSFWRIAEPLWVGALGVQFVVVGPAVIRALIRLMGRAGQAETVEWAVHMVFLLAFLPLAWIIGWLVPRFGGVRAGNWIRRGLVIATALEGLMYLASAERPLAAAAILAGITAATALYAVSRRDDSPVSPGALKVAIGVGVFAWMSAGALVHWQSAVGWLFDLPARFIVALASVTLAAAVLHRWSTGNESLSRVPALDWAALAILGVFSFRTFPMVEFYHWSFFIGPIDQLRNGGTLLWDTPSQYGFLSILIPALLPGSSWQAFWFHQSVAYVVVAFVMYLGIRKLAAGWTGSAFALVVTFMTLYFRPRGDGWLLPAPMTPGAGPVRFVWCLVVM